MRGLVTEALTESASVVTATVTDDAGGGGSITFANGTAIACRVDTITGSEGEVAGRVSDRSTHLLTLPAGTDLSADDLLYVTGRGTFEVTAVHEHTGEFARFAELVART